MGNISYILKGFCTRELDTAKNKTDIPWRRNESRSMHCLRWKS